ncbi:MAG: zinc ribbon domain-containing protein [Chloroflexi bacterium]|nr:zinc ribbon domain-containing protein [Chloroflexota bacterium]
MRDCPNCSEQIQDEAAYCRHCHTELEPPLWLASMRKCPYCAEWIENDLERCKYCDRTLSEQHAAPFVETSSTPDDLTQALRLNLLDDDSDEAAAISAAAQEFVTEGPGASFASFEAGLVDERPEESPADIESEPLSSSDPPSDPGGSLYDKPQSDAGSSLYDESQLDLRRLPDDEPQSDLRRSLYDESPGDETIEEPSTHYEQGDEALEYDEPPASVGDSSIWMAGADPDVPVGTGPLAGERDPIARSVTGVDGVSDLRAEASGPKGKIRRTAGKMARTVVIIGVLGAAIWGLVRLAQGPAGAFVSELLATDVPTLTPIPQPTSTRRPAPTLPPLTEESAIGPSPVQTPSPENECVSWDTVALEDEGAELCVFGVLKRWFAGGEIAFVAIFSEEAGTFAMIDRTTTHPVGPGDCILARGTVEIMQATRPNIDVQGTLEACPEGLVEG